MKYKKGQFIVIPNKDIIKGKNPALQCIYMWICSYANEDGECYPSINRLEQDCDCSKNTVLKYIKELVDLGILVKENRFKSNEQISNLYNIIIVDKMWGCNGGTGGSATDELPSATDELGGSATDEYRTKSNSGTKSIKQTNLYIKGVEDFILFQKSNIPGINYQIEKQGESIYLQKQYEAYNKILSINKIDSNSLDRILEFVKQDKFWNKQIGSITKLLDKNKEGVPYWVVMIDKIKSKIDDAPKVFKIDI